RSCAKADPETENREREHAVARMSIAEKSHVSRIAEQLAQENKRNPRPGARDLCGNVLHTHTLQPGRLPEAPVIVLGSKVGHAPFATDRLDQPALLSARCVLRCEPRADHQMPSGLQNLGSSCEEGCL